MGKNPYMNRTLSYLNSKGRISLDSVRVDVNETE